MKINYLKINGFGKIKNKEINFNNNINLIYGKNESGKTTILKFIYSMFYGCSKNKNGKDISDFEKYKPWNADEYSGKIKYKLDNNEEYEIFREFSKKNPKIYNEKLEDISKEYSIDKNKGNQFFYEQTKIDEYLFSSTHLVEQQNVVLDNNSQNLLTQKISNILSSGEDNISYKKVIGSLSKKLIEEVGTDRTVDRPLNKVLKEINELKQEKRELELYSNMNIENNLKKEKIEEQLITLEQEINLLKEIKLIKEKEEIDKKEIYINKKIENEYDEKIINLKNKIKNINNNKNNIKRNENKVINSIFIVLLIFLNILINFIKLENIIEKAIIYFTIIYLICNLVIYLTKRKHYKSSIEKEDIERIKLEKEIEILEENKENKKKEILKIEAEILNKNETNLELIKSTYKNKIILERITNLFNKNIQQINSEYEQLNNEYNNKKIELNAISIEEKNIGKKLENKASCEERLQYLLEQQEELLKLERSITIAKDALEEAYKKMKNEITPKFTKDLSLLISKISDGKYNRANFDSEYGLTVEKENGEYIGCNNLSIGTIDQLYLSLRLSMLNEVSEEKMPIILDEAFAYYDNERLENILKFIKENYKDNQIVIFTCSNREKEIMDKLNINYNLINL